MIGVIIFGMYFQPDIIFGFEILNIEFDGKERSLLSFRYSRFNGGWMDILFMRIRIR